VRQIFDWYIEVASTAEIARRLNAAGVPTKHRSRPGWIAQTVSKLVGVALEAAQMRRALLDREGDMTIEFSIPEPVMSFDFSTS
jgi:hypothetical protein